MQSFLKGTSEVEKALELENRIIVATSRAIRDVHDPFRLNNFGFQTNNTFDKQAMDLYDGETSISGRW